MYILITYRLLFINSINKITSKMTGACVRRLYCQSVQLLRADNCY